MTSILIADTTRDERERIVADSIGNIDGLCDGCSCGIIEMYNDYIDGLTELAEINRRFSTAYVKSSPEPERSDSGCVSL